MPDMNKNIIQPKAEIYRQPLRDEDILQPEIDINNHFEKYEKTINKRR